MKQASGTINRQIRINHMQILNRTSLINSGKSLLSEGAEKEAFAG